MAIKTYKIRCQITLQSYMEEKSVDLTPHVRMLSIQKSLYQPAGRFEIQLLPGTDKNKASWYYRISPMDYVEIRFTRDASLKEIPVVMRGFVDDIALQASVDNEGRPNRVYTIYGSDMGKLFEITRIYYLKEVAADLQLILLPTFKKLEEKYGCKIDGTPKKVIKSLFDIAANQLSLIRKTQKTVPEMKYLVDENIEGVSNQFALSQDDGSIWDLMAFFDNSPWNELFTVDLEDAFYLVFRQTPWKDYDTGGYIQKINSDVDKRTLGASISVEPNSILRFNLRRSECEAKNYFFTYPTQNMMTGETSFKAAVLKGVNKEEDLKTNPYLIPHDDRDAGAYRFGFRRFENSSEYFDPKNMVISKELTEKLNLALYKAFKYNSAYESGNFTLKGDARLRPGVYMTFDYRTGVAPEYYVVGVNHELNLVQGMESFSTTVNVQRGDGYLRTRDMINNADQKLQAALK